MRADRSSAAGSNGGIAKSGKSIYDTLHDSPDLFTTGTLTKKYQAKSRAPVTQSVLVSQSDSYSVHDAIAALPIKS